MKQLGTIVQFDLMNRSEDGLAYLSIIQMGVAEIQNGPFAFLAMMDFLQKRVLFFDQAFVFDSAMPATSILKALSINKCCL